MSKPALNKLNPGHVPVQIKTVFFTEGNPIALLVTTIGRRRDKSTMRFRDAHEALTWCQSHDSRLFYAPTNITHG